MYTVDFLEQKNLRKLKAIARDCGISPSGDKRCRQVWVEALIGVNPPLLQLLEVLSADSEHPPGAIDIQHQEPIELATENSPGVEIEQRLEPIELATENSPGVSFDATEFRQTHRVEIESYFKSFAEVDRCQESIEHFPGVDVNCSQELIEVQSQEPLVECWQCEGDGFWGDGGSLWECSHCEGDGRLTSFLLAKKEPETLLWHYGAEDSLKAFENLRKKSHLGDFNRFFYCGKFHRSDIGTDRKNISACRSGTDVDEVTEDAKRCPCDVMLAVCCDGRTATHIYPDRVVSVPCYRTLQVVRPGLVFYGDRVRDRSPPGGDVIP